MLPSAESIQIILPVISILFLVFTFKQSIYGTISYFIILNAKLGDMYPVLGAIRFELVAAIIVLASIFIGRGNIANAFPQTDALNKPFWMLFAIGMLSVPQAVDVSVSWQNGGYFLLKLTLFYVMVVASINDRKDLEKMVWALLLVSAWTAYEPVVNYLQGGGEQHGYGKIAIGSFGVATGHVALANTLNQSLPIAIYWAISQKKKIFIGVAWCLIALIALGIVFSKSRGGFIGLLTTSAGVIYFSKNRIKTFAIFAALLIFLLPLAGQQYLSHMATIKEGVHGSRSSSDRYLGLINGISMMIKRPVLGVGIGCYAEARSRYFNYYFYAHNLYGELFGELGLASAVWFYWVYSVFLRCEHLKKLMAQQDSGENQFPLLLTGIQLGLLVRLVIGNFSHCAFIWFWFLMAALTVSIENIMNQKRQFRPSAVVV